MDRTVASVEPSFDGGPCFRCGASVKVLVTGGAGYVGSHLLVELLLAGHRVTVLDTLENSSLDGVMRAERIAGKSCTFLHGSVCRPRDVRRALAGVDVVCHLAAHKHVNESLRQPDRYHANNVGGMRTLLREMASQGLHRIVFSSSAAVYGAQGAAPLHEGACLQPHSPYGRSKLEGERLLDRCADAGWAAVSLRFFNPVGAHPSGALGEAMDRAKGLLPQAMRARLGNGGPLVVFGTDYPTPDGTCQRDYVHVMDVARAHLVAMEALCRPGHRVYNVGTGRPTSVRDVISACVAASHGAVPYVLGARREGDMAVAVADCARFREEHGFEARFDLRDMATSAWRWAVLRSEGRAPEGVQPASRLDRVQPSTQLPPRAPAGGLDESGHRAARAWWTERGTPKSHAHRDPFLPTGRMG